MNNEEPTLAIKVRVGQPGSRTKIVECLGCGTEYIVASALKYSYCRVCDLTMRILRQWEVDDRPKEFIAKSALIQQQAQDIYEGLKKLLGHYKQLVMSGDCGFWDVGKEPIIVNIEALLAKIDGSGAE